MHWLSNSPWSPTGYGNQIELFLPLLHAAGHRQSITAFYGLEGRGLTWQGIQVSPKAYHPYGQDIAAADAQNEQSDLLMSLMDAWVCDADLLQKDGTPWVPWFPVDMEPLPPPVAKQVAKAFARIVFSKFGERMVNDAGLDCLYIPHGVDTEKLSDKIPMMAARKTLRGAQVNVRDDSFLLGMVAANQGNPSRKAFTANLRAFAELRKHHKDV